MKRTKNMWVRGSVALALLLSIMYFHWMRGRIVAESGPIRVRKVPLTVDGLYIPGVVGYCYVVEVGDYPYETTFRARWSSYEADDIKILKYDNPDVSFVVEFDTTHKVTCLYGGDVPIAEWNSR